MTTELAEIRKLLEKHSNYFHGDDGRPGIFVRLALLEDFVSLLRKLGITGMVAVLGLWLNLLWQMYEHFSKVGGN